MRSSVASLMALTTILLASTAYASDDYPTPKTTLEALQLESRMRWTSQEGVRFLNSLSGSVFGATGLVVSGFNLDDAGNDIVRTQYQGAAGGLFLTASAFALSAPVLEMAGENTVANHRLHLGLTSGAWLLSGAAFIFRSMDVRHRL
jgi:hypothetical protein